MTNETCYYCHTQSLSVASCGCSHCNNCEEHNRGANCGTHGVAETAAPPAGPTEPAAPTE